MAKVFFRLQKFLRRTQFLLFFLTAAYLMAGSLLLLQRARLAAQQGPRGSSGLALPGPDMGLGAKAADPHLAQSPGAQLPMGVDTLPEVELRHSPRWMASRNSELRWLRRRWFHRFIGDQEPMQTAGLRAMRGTAEHKGKGRAPCQPSGTCTNCCSPVQPKKRPAGPVRCARSAFLQLSSTFTPVPKGMSRPE